MAAKKKTRRYWGGFVDGTLDHWLVDTGLGGMGVGLRDMPMLFKTRRDARDHFQDVRPIIITYETGK